MRFRPCIDIHNGRVKQIVGGTLRDADDSARENYVSDRDAAWYADLFRRHDLPGGHIILLNPVSSEHYEATLAQAMDALLAYPGGMQIGGGITPENAQRFLDAGASHVIVTSFVFHNGKIDLDRLLELVASVGRERLVLDLSCRKNGDNYYVVTDRWQNITDVPVTAELLAELKEYCDEFLIHAVDAEGKKRGVEVDLVRRIINEDDCPVSSFPDDRAGAVFPLAHITYAGGIATLDDIETLRMAGNGRLDFTVGSALDIFGGSLALADVAAKAEGP